MLLAVGVVFFLVSLSYAEGVAALPEPGGAATLVRRAYNDPAGFATGWLLFLDYLIVIALAALFVPHYLGSAVGWDAITDGPWDVVVAVVVVVTLAAVRLVRRPRIYRIAIAIAGIALAVELLLVVLGFALVFSPGDLTAAVDFGTAPSVSSLVFALALATLAYTGLETVANYAAETREPGQALPRALFAGVGLVVVVTTLVAIVGVAAYPVEPDASAPDGVATALGTVWLQEPLVGIAAAFDDHLPNGVGDVLRVVVGLTGVLVLLAAITTSISGAGRLAHSLASRNMLPRSFARVTRTSSIAPAAVVSTAVIASCLLVGASVLGTPVRGLASLYSFGVLLAFAAAQLAVIRLRFAEPDLARPFRAAPNIRVGGASVPLPALVGLPLTVALWIGAVATHGGARVAGPVWLALGAVVYVLVRRHEHEGVLERVEPAPPDLVAAHEGAYSRILVPLKLGEIGEEVLATALRLADEHGAHVDVVHVIKVPLDLPLDVALEEREARALESIAEAKEICGEHGVEIHGQIVRARSLGEAIVGQASRRAPT